MDILLNFLGRVVFYKLCKVPLGGDPLQTSPLGVPTPFALFFKFPVSVSHQNFHSIELYYLHLDRPFLYPEQFGYLSTSLIFHPDLLFSDSNLF